MHRCVFLSFLLNICFSYGNSEFRSKNEDELWNVIEKKIAIEVAWNDYIVQKYNNAVLVDEDKIRNKIKNLSKKNYVENLLLS